MQLTSNFKFKVLYEIEDVTEGKENVQISCVNTWTSDPPPHVEYAAKRFPGKGVDLNEDKEFLIGCSCTDYCQVSLHFVIVLFLSH